MEYNESMKHISSRTILGALVIVIGVALLLSSLNIWNFGEIVSIWWPLAVIVMGIIIFINDRSAYLWALLIVAIGVVWQLNRLESRLRWFRWLLRRLRLRNVVEKAIN